jgi:hypothetical protein
MQIRRWGDLGEVLHVKVVPGHLLRGRRSLDWGKAKRNTQTQKGRPEGRPFRKLLDGAS